MRILSGLLFVLLGLVNAQVHPQGVSKLFVPKSGFSFQPIEIQKLQNDDFANPGFLWRDEGERLFRHSITSAEKPCAGCHHDNANSLEGAAARYPQYDKSSQRLINLEQRINRCRKVQQQEKPFNYESEPLLALTTYVASLSNGKPFNVKVDGPAKPFFEAGKKYFYKRIGQLNLACNHCHELNVGKNLRGDLLSQGQSNNYPTYRLDWQTQGSLHRRLRFCNTGVRAEPFSYGAEEYVNLELFLAWRAGTLPIEVPSVRR